MAIKVIAQRRELKIGNKPGKRFIMRPDLYSAIAEKKVFRDAATRSDVWACWIDDYRKRVAPAPCLTIVGTWLAGTAEYW